MPKDRKIPTEIVTRDHLNDIADSIVTQIDLFIDGLDIKSDHLRSIQDIRKGLRQELLNMVRTKIGV